ncbi:IS66 family insertion sequence element accessory protein TnpB [Cystobacter fuscus]
MIGSTRRLAVYAYGQPCDMRKSYDALSGLVTRALGRDFLSGDVFLFVGRDRKRAKALFWDGTGLCLYAKRLEKGRFAPLWRSARGEQPFQLTVSELASSWRAASWWDERRCRPRRTRWRRSSSHGPRAR